MGPSAYPESAPLPQRTEGRAVIMTEQGYTETRRYHFEQIKAKEIARGASEEEATRVAMDNVDRVMAQEHPAEDK